MLVSVIQRVNLDASVFVFSCFRSSLRFNFLLFNLVLSCLFAHTFAPKHAVVIFDLSDVCARPHHSLY